MNRSFFKSIADLRFAIFILLMIATLSVIGTVIEQDQSIETYKLNYIGLEIKESDAEELKLFGVNHGVKIRQVLNKNLKGYGLEDSIIIKINDKKITSIEDAKYILNNVNKSNPIKITFVDKVGEINSFIFR